MVTNEFFGRRPWFGGLGLAGVLCLLLLMLLSYQAWSERNTSYLEPKMDPKTTHQYVAAAWKDRIIPELERYIAIPNQSPLFDPEWASNGLQEQAMDVLVGWVTRQHVKGLRLELLKEPGRTPFLLITIPAFPGSAGNNNDDDDVDDNKDNNDDANANNDNETVLMYGHMDKQPPLTEDWAPGLGPYTPVIRDGKLYGRGGADDGYSVFAAIAAVQAVRAQPGGRHGRIVIAIEACEESGSKDLPYWLERAAVQIGRPSLVVCLDSGAGDYDRLWLTASLRGTSAFDLEVTVLREGVHSGMASGVVPSSFRILRMLLDRVEDSRTGEILVPEAHSPVPQEFQDYARRCAQLWGDRVWQEFPFVEGARPAGGEDNAERLLSQWWRPSLSYVGQDGMPASKSAGNVLRSSTNLRLSLRLPPDVDPAAANARFKEILEADPPYGAQVKVTLHKTGQGFKAPPVADWLQRSLETSSKAFYDGNTVQFMGMGGSIPFMNMLGRMFPGTQFMVVGVLGPQSNAHGPNEFLHLAYGERLTCCVAHALHDHALAAAGSAVSSAENDAQA